MIFKKAADNYERKEEGCKSVLSEGGHSTEPDHALFSAFYRMIESNPFLKSQDTSLLVRHSVAL